MLDTSRRNFLGGSAALVAATSSAHSAIAKDVERATFSPSPELAWLVWNENPYGPSPAAIRAISETASQGAYYADAVVDRMAEMIAERHGISPKQVVIGTGSGELLHAISLAWGQRGKIVCPSLFFGGSVKYAERLGATAERVPLTEEMQIDLVGLAAGVDDETSMVQICNPDNPTGLILPQRELHAFALAVAGKATVLVDEAYNELTDDPDGNSLVGLVRQGSDVIVTRTFSKIYGMAGLRVGYAMTSEENASLIRQSLMNASNSTSGLAAAIASYEDDSFLNYSRAKIVEARQMIESAVAQASLVALPSQTNFVYVKVPDANAVRDAMRQHGIVIRGAYDGWPQYSRVSCGRLEDVQRYASALPRVLENLST
ncbi:pyridoxal phosphate-dependent aminotransferase [Altererythrobacter sp. MF3-039]|uniref:pyridoxal phosphate-dependent aminotransferase n=1 Tax=Altererythrobacter sp. MF3-039 TaxID=3252901 RepID=UPI00390C85DF